MTEDAEGCKRTLALPNPPMRRRGRTGCRADSRTAATSRQYVVIRRAFPQRSFASFCASCAVFAPFSVRFVPICAQNACNLQHSKNRFSFVFKYFLASFPLFSIFWISRVPLAPEHSRLTSRRVVLWPSPTTICPHHDHNYRLSCPPRLVKRKMQTETGNHGNGQEMGWPWKRFLTGFPPLTRFSPADLQKSSAPSEWTRMSATTFPMKEPSSNEKPSVTRAPAVATRCKA